MGGESARERAAQARAKADRLSRYAEQWEKGAEGESQTATALGALGEGWTIWHDLKWPGRRFANIDHLVIGPGGVFVIDSKNWSGSISIRDDVLRQNGYRREPAVASCADSALAVGELIPHHLAHVRPVLCFARDEQIGGWARDVILCSTANIVEMLRSRPTVMSPFDIGDVATTLQARMYSMPTGQPAPTRSRRASSSGRRQPSRTKSRRRKKTKMPVWLRLVYFGVCAVLLLVAIQVVPAVIVAVASSNSSAH